MADLTPIRSIIVDDERPARRLFKEMLLDYPEVTLAGEASNVDEGLALISKTNPDLVFLDVEMPGKSGFDLVESLVNTNLNNGPDIVFFTAFDKYAIRAIQCAAFDYLLKPVSNEDISRVVSKYFEKNKSELKSQMSLLLDYVKGRKIILDMRVNYLVFNAHELVCCQAEGNYTHLHMLDGTTEIATWNLGQIEQKLPSPDFIRINRSTVININYIKKINNKFKNCVLSYNNSVKTFKISKSATQPLAESMNIISG